MKSKILFVAILFALIQPACAADPPDLYIAPYLQNVTPQSITVMWETSDPVIGKVEYGQNGGFNQSSTESAPAKIHEVHLTGLEPGTTYNYRASYGKTKLSPAKFTTAPPPGTKNWRMVVYGDNRSNPDTHTKNVEQIMKLNPGIVLNSGDLVASGSVYEQWKPQFFDPLRGLSEYVPVFPCLGNHERNAVHYYNYMSLPDEKKEVYYSFDYANAHIISLNSNSKDAPFQLGDEQTEWLIQDLKDNQDKTWIIVFFHHPLFRCHPTRGITSQRWVWQPIFDQYGVDLVVNGHDHYYQRTYAVGNYTGEPRRGVYHLVSGGGGAGTYPIVPKVHAAARRRVHHITVMDVEDDRIVGRAIDIDGNTFDAFVYDQQAENAPEEFMAYEIYLLERDLGEAIRKMPAIKTSATETNVDQWLEVPNPFKAPVRMTFSWQGTNGWEVTPQTETRVLEPGAPIRLRIQANNQGQTIYPIPTAQLEFAKPDGEKAFRNDVLKFYPLKIRPEQN
ncbi:MAG: metallophosphoesterase family protein, partial [Candidatus Latescibacteria bacterium]|nr:metallophosphoesterase family protein [Candidatus Latescibacterota bacterium]